MSVDSGYRCVRTHPRRRNARKRSTPRRGACLVALEGRGTGRVGAARCRRGGVGGRREWGKKERETKECRRPIGEPELRKGEGRDQSGRERGREGGTAIGREGGKGFQWMDWGEGRWEGEGELGVQSDCAARGRIATGGVAARPPPCKHTLA